LAIHIQVLAPSSSAAPLVDEPIGTGSFLHAFFSTLSAHGEPDGWGSRFPVLMKALYRGRLSHTQASAALTELRAAKELLSQLSPTLVVWDIENRGRRPPWGSNIAPTITNLGNYFVSSAGKDLFGVFEAALTAASRERLDVVIG
jgi:hypothetical protein